MGKAANLAFLSEKTSKVRVWQIDSVTQRRAEQHPAPDDLKTTE
jgi:hypothetical protein